MAHNSDIGDMDADEHFSIDFESGDDNFLMTNTEDNLAIEPISRRDRNLDANASLLNMSTLQPDADAIMRNGYAATPIKIPFEEKSSSGGGLGGSRLLKQKTIDKASAASPDPVIQRTSMLRVRNNEFSTPTKDNSAVGNSSGGSSMKSDISFPSLSPQNDKPDKPMRLLGRNTTTPVKLNFPPLLGETKADAPFTPSRSDSPIKFNESPIKSELSFPTVSPETNRTISHRPTPMTPVPNRVTFDDNYQSDPFSRTMPLNETWHAPPIQVPESPPPQPYIPPVPVSPLPLSVIETRTPVDRVEGRISTNLDKSISSFTKLFGCELSSMMRPSSNRMPSIDIDGFCEDLVSELNSVVNITAESIDGNVSIMNRKVVSAIDEQMLPVVSACNAASVQQKEFNDRKMVIMRQIQSDIESVKGVFRNGGDAIVRELERERDNTIAFRDMDSAMTKEMTRKLKQLEYRRAEMEEHVARQKSDADAIYRALKTLENKRKEFYEKVSDPRAPGRSRAERIMSEISEVKSEMEENNRDELIEKLEESLRIVLGDIDIARGELIQYEMANRWMTSRLGAGQRKAASPARGSPTSKLTVAAQKKIDEVRRFRKSPVHNFY